MQEQTENENALGQSDKKRTRRKRNCEDERQHKCTQCSK